eukprot:90859-Prorocentrum_minimum.AAC.1
MSPSSPLPPLFLGRYLCGSASDGSLAGGDRTAGGARWLVCRALDRKAAPFVSLRSATSEAYLVHRDQ